MFGNGKIVSVRRALVVVSLFWLFLGITTPAAPQGSGTFTTIDVTGAGTGTLQGTFALGIDTAGDVAGTYSDSNGIAHGFVRAASGTITTYTAPLAGIAGVGSTTGGKGTFFTSMDGAGDIAGYYSDANNLYHALVLPAGSTAMSYFDDSGATTFGHLGTAATGINSAGVVTGFFRDANLVYHGFVRATNGTFTQIDATGAGTGTNQGTEPLSINSAGVITGFFSDANFVHHGFVRAVDGTISIITAPGANTAPGTAKSFNGTMASGINTAGVIVGGYSDSSHVFHLFVRAADGTIIPIVTPGDGFGAICETVPHNFICGSGGLSINTAGDITGTYADTSAIMHGFLRPVDSGIITSFDAPGAGNTGTFQGTGGFGINDGGTIAGMYVDTNAVVHGFIYTPALTATTTTLSPVPTPNPSLFGEPVTLSATVASSGGAPPDGENVTFMSGTTTLGTAQLTSGVASFTTTALPVGTDSITAVYGGDLNFSGSTSSPVSEAVGKAKSYATLTSSVNPSTFGQSLTLTATVTGQFGGTATGTVTFSNGSTSLGTGSLSGNSAGLTTTMLPVGTDSITAVYSGDSNFAGSTSNAVSQVVNTPPPAATPTFSVPAGTYASAQSVTVNDATAGATVYYTTNGTTPTTSSTKYTGAITVSSSETLEAIATASNYSNSAVATAAYVISIPANPVPVMSSMSPAYTSAGGAAFTLTITGSGFTASSTAYWGTSALATQYGSATQLTTQVTAAEIANAGISAITVQTPTPGGGTSNSLQFEVDSAGSGTSTTPTFTSLTATVAAGSTASFAVTAPAGVTIDSVTCLNLPAGATCSYSSASNAVTIATSAATTPAGTYQVTVVFTETVPGAAAAGILLPILLLPLLLLRRKLAARGIWLSACVGLLLLAATAFSIGCGGGGSKTSTTGQTHQVTSSGMLSLTVK